MLSSRSGRLIYELSKNSRISTKKLGNSLRVSQQSASYLISSLQAKNVLQDYKCIIDPARLGLINVFVLYHFKNLDGREIATMRINLAKHPNVVAVTQVSQGSDLLLEFSVANLSLFNKKHSEILFEYKKLLQVDSIFVVIVKHIYDKKYLSKVPTREELIVCGDREITILEENELKVLKEFHLKPKQSQVAIAKQLKIDPKTVATIKKRLEKRGIIGKYSVVINNEGVGIWRGLIFAEFDFDSPKDISKLLEFCLQHKNIVEAIKLIGPYSILIIIEESSFSGKALRDLRENFKVSNYRIIQSDKIIKEKSLPASIWGLGE